MISLTTLPIQMQIQGNTKHRRLCCSSTNRLLISDFKFFDTRRETQFLKVFRNHTMLITPTTFGTSRGLISNSQLHGRTPTSQHHGRTQLLHTMFGPQLHNIILRTQLNLFQKLPNSQPISSGHDVIHTPASFPVWGFIMTMVIVISFARERKLHASVNTPGLLTRIV